MQRPTVAQKRDVFRELHNDGCFVIPNPWDMGSAQSLSSLGFKALATTSSGLAWSMARPDGTLTRDETLAHMRMMVEATDLPINSDFESGFGRTLEELAQSVELAVESGVAGLSIEDSTGRADSPVRDIAEGVERIRVARSVIDRLAPNTMLIGRAENFFVGIQDLADTIERLQAYSEAGADCLYAPGIKSISDIKAVVMAVAPKPVNVLIGGNSELTVDILADLGVRRISVGGGLARAAWGGFLAAARDIAGSGRFDRFGDAPSGAELNKLFLHQPGALSSN